jgi:anthranilate/para-aminobenzoate synthase component I
MEIIDELEPVKRGIYAGAVGYLGFNGDMDLAIAIRTAIVKDGQLHVQAGAGIVADSDPASEWQETQNKAQRRTARRRTCRARPRHALLKQPGLPQSAARVERAAAC